VTDGQSGIESWNFINRLERKNDDVEGTLPLVLAVICSLGVAPFAILRFMHGEILVALLDAAIICGMLLLGGWVYRTQKIRSACILLSVLCVLGVSASVYASGPQQVLWAYPAVMALFYLLRPREAVVLILVMLSMILPVLLSEHNAFRTISIVITLLLMGAFAYSFAAVSNRQREMLLRLATKDPLTGVGNRRALDTKLSEIVVSRRRNTAPASLILFDLDNFKDVNDTHGHAKGDQILQIITEIVNLRIRVTDSLYRIGGEEFVVVADHQNLDKAGHLAEQLRLLVEANELANDHSVTISLGVAELRAGELGSEWLKRADAALYNAKRSGRNATALAY
jgi:diguanylate cyclase (GGDEF)-like protein